VIIRAGNRLGSVPPPALRPPARAGSFTGAARKCLQAARWTPASAAVDNHRACIRHGLGRRAEELRGVDLSSTRRGGRSRSSDYVDFQRIRKMAYRSPCEAYVETTETLSVRVRLGFTRRQPLPVSTCEPRDASGGSVIRSFLAALRLVRFAMSISMIGGLSSREPMPRLSVVGGPTTAGSSRWIILWRFRTGPPRASTR
jgi:hypothetical protein